MAVQKPNPGSCRRWRCSGPKIYDIFEGTEQIQQLVVVRAISGRHIA
ncbi:hypothetical protein [Saccharopolyspora hordei]|uniref:Uncharacterized protein n=1 Tax=Saccharopolyspora hordei TaxID=1838 RepID=A0A853ADS9_9PSEU|nr:hypothetical protein [Saccharopolyspora hordei]NYI82088.1 hypothetical protein [Saccharopolyspora hordei]